MSTVNKQPIFADAPLMVSRLSTSSSSDNGSTPVSNIDDIYTCTDAEGVIIERITVTPKISTGGGTTDTLIYICLYDASTVSEYHTYAVKQLPATSVSDTVPPPQAQFIFDGGVLLKQNDKIGIGRSVGGGDDLHVILEGGRYQVV